jgi:hypothetical protein
MNLDALAGRERVLPPPNDSRYDKWRKWLKVVDSEITSMFLRRETWRGLVTIIQANPTIPPSHFFDFLAHGYVTMQATAIRRQADVDSRVISLASLLLEVVKYPETVSRRRFVSQYPWGAQYMRDSAFDDFAGKGLSHIDPVRVQTDLDKLQAAAVATKRYVDRHVAHTDKKRRPEDIPSFSELDTAIETSGALLQRYLLLFEQVDRDPIAPIPHYDWVAPFRLPWIVPDDTDLPWKG